jgi:hypothetical protein
MGGIGRASRCQKTQKEHLYTAVTPRLWPWCFHKLKGSGLSVLQIILSCCSNELLFLLSQTTIMTDILERASGILIQLFNFYPYSSRSDALHFAGILL